MSSIFDRELIAQAVIVLALCFGGWAIFVQPKVQEISRLEGLVARSAAIQAMMDENEVEAVATRVSTLRARIKRIRESGELARDSSRLYEVLMQLAADHDVVMQNLHSDIKKSDSTSNKVLTTDIHMTIVGEFESIASFLEALDRVDGLIRPDSLNLTPAQTGDRRLAQARISCQALAFPLPAELTALLGADDGNR